MPTASCWSTLSTAVTTTGEGGGWPATGPFPQALHRTGPHLCLPGAQGTWGLSVHFISPGALTLGTIFASGFMTILIRSGPSTKHSLRTTPPRLSRCVGRRQGAGPGLGEEEQVEGGEGMSGKGVPWELVPSLPSA